MNIIPLSSYGLDSKKPVFFQKEENKPETSINKYEYNKYPIPFSKTFLVSFGARVDKGLNRFFDANAEVMPKTVSDYIKTLADDAPLSPIEAHREAFSMLDLAGSVEEIKDVFPDEPLFQNLISTSESKARVGLIHDINVMRDVFNDESTPPVKTGEDLTVYLVKKIFLENKTLADINEDLDKDLDDFFRKDDKKYVGYSTLDALGIKYPDTSYLTSLRYTQEGYSDQIGEKLSKSLSDFYKNLTPEQRTERNSKSLKNIERWWSELSDEDKKALLSEKSSEVAFLKLYEKAKKPTSSKPSEKPVSNDSETEKQPVAAERTPKIKTSLSDDPLFVQWATLNLEAYKASLTPDELAEISEKKSLRMIDMWSSFSPEEKTDYISKMFIGSEKQKVAMIDAWNNSPEIRKDLSAFLKAKNLYRPEGLMYRTQEYSEAQSKVMKEFWAVNPQHAEKLGKEISASYEKVSKAFQNGTFDALRQEIIDAQSAAKQEVRSKKFNDTKSPVFKEFARLYAQTYSFLPKGFLQAYLKDVEVLDDNVVSEWSRALKGEIKRLSPDSINKLESYDGSIFTEKAAMRQALAEVLYDATSSSDVFTLRYSQLVSIIATALKEKHRPLEMGTENRQQKHTIKIAGDINIKKIDKLYNDYSRPLSEKDLNQIIDNLNITKDNPLYDDAVAYIKRFGFLIKKFMDPETTLGLDAISHIQNNFMEKVEDPELGQLLLDSTTNSNIRKGVDKLLKKYPFLPEAYAQRKVDDTIIRFVDDPDANYEKMIDSNVADEYMAFILRCTLYAATNDDSVFDYNLDNCVEACSDVYSGKKSVGEVVMQGGARLLRMPDLTGISGLYDMLSEENDFVTDTFGLSPEYIDSLPKESQEFVQKVTDDFNQKYYNIKIYLELLGLSKDKKEEIKLELFKDFIEHSEKVNRFLLEGGKNMA